MVHRSALAVLALVAAPAFAAPQPPADHGYFISIDGLNPSLLEALDTAGVLSQPHGLGALHREGLVVDRARPAVSLTAASHVSTITCSPPSRHGIVANGYILNGERVSGYTHPFTSEPLWRSASRQGHTVLSLAYVGSDATTPERTPDYGLAYPVDALLGPSQSLDWTLADLPVATGWQADASVSLAEAHESTITVVLNPQTHEQRTIQALVVPTPGAAPTLYLDDDKNLANGTLGTLGGASPLSTRADLFFVETDAASAVPGVKRRAFVRLLPGTDGHLAVYVSKASYNNAFPASFRQQLDDADLVWPDYGVRSNALSAADYLDAQAMIDRFLTDVGVRFAPALGADVVLFYQPLIDTVGHKLQNALPLPFDPSAADDVTQTFVGAFRIIDENVSRLLAAATPNDAVALMGDHGMDPVRKVVNVARLLPADHTGKLEIVASGSLMLVYPPLAGTGDATEAATATTLARDLAASLRELRFEDTPIAGLAADRLDFLPGRSPDGDYTKEWQFGDALFALSTASGFWLQYFPQDEHLFLDPTAGGMHGLDPSVPTMATTLMIKGPGIHPRHIPNGTLLDAVPTFSALMGIDPPADCVGRSLL
jgi:hypothetical protein